MHGASGLRQKAEQGHRGLGFGEVEGEGGGVLLDFEFDRGFRAIRFNDCEGMAGKGLGGQGDLHLAGGLGQLSAALKRDAQQVFALLACPCAAPARLRAGARPSHARPLRAAAALRH